MTMHSRNITPVSPVALDDVFGAARPRQVVAKASSRRPSRAPINVNGPSLVVVVPDRVDAVIGVCSEAGLKGGAKLLWALGMMLLVAL
jgi:hypothetical protein